MSPGSSRTRPRASSLEGNAASAPAVTGTRTSQALERAAPRAPQRRAHARAVACLAAAILLRSNVGHAVVTSQSPAVLSTSDIAGRAERAEKLAREAMAAVRHARAAAVAERDSTRQDDSDRAAADHGLDADRRALIGREITPLVTTLGSLSSKHLSTDPRWGRALVFQLASRGIRPGSPVAASFSGSFPGLDIAVIAACRALDARLVAVSSVTASTWGANEPGWTWPEMEALIVRAGVLPRASAAISLGGLRDTAADLDDEGRAEAKRIQSSAAASLGAKPLAAATLVDAIQARLDIYRRAFDGRPDVYVNVGGNHASLGGANAPFRHDEGWLSQLPPGTSARSSVVHAMLSEGVPVLNLLDVKALARAWNLEKDDDRE